MRRGDRIVQLARNRYAVAVTMRWQLSGFVNLVPLARTEGVVVLPPARAHDTDGPAIELTAFALADPRAAFHRDYTTHERFGSPAAGPTRYAYALPFAPPQAFTILQGFHGAFSHRGSNEYAIDFACPVATTVVAAREGTVVAANAAAQGSGITPEYLDYHRVNFVMVLHDDGTIGEYMHLSPSGVMVSPGQRVARGQPLALSGNTGFSSTPHLHFQVMTAAPDGVAAQSFPFELAVAAGRTDLPVTGQRYAAWESR